MTTKYKEGSANEIRLADGRFNFFKYNHSPDESVFLQRSQCPILSCNLMNYGCKNAYTGKNLKIHGEADMWKITSNNVHESFLENVCY